MTTFSPRTSDNVCGARDKFQVWSDVINNFTRSDDETVQMFKGIVTSHNLNKHSVWSFWWRIKCTFLFLKIFQDIKLLYACPTIFAHELCWHLLLLQYWGCLDRSLKRRGREGGSWGCTHPSVQILTLPSSPFQWTLWTGTGEILVKTGHIFWTVETFGEEGDLQCSS